MLKQDTKLIFAGLRIVTRNKGYIFWFWLLNLTLAEFGTAAFRSRLHAALDSSLLADRLLHGFDHGVYLEMVARPEWGPPRGSAVPAMYFSFLFFLVTLFCMPGVLDAYTSEGKPSREDFFRCCGRNVWRFARVLVFYGIVAGLIGGALLSGHVALVHVSKKSTYELLPFYTHLATLGVIFLVLTVIRIWFDLAQVDVVVRDQRAVRKSVAAAFRYTQQNLIALLATYVVICLLGVAVLAGGLWVWRSFVPPSNVLGAFLVTQVIVILWLGMRFWQRACAAAFYMRETPVEPPIPATAEPSPSSEFRSPLAPPVDGAAPPQG
jgi:hypothetical protein